MDYTSNIQKIFKIFKASKAEIRPHFFLTGSSGSGKTYLIRKLAAESGLEYVQVNAAGLTKEGTSGNSVSKALSVLRNKPNKPLICFVDEFDKLLISGNHNSELAHETTNGVQNEFLTVLESDLSSVFGDYGKYVEVPTKNVLFVFAGAFNGEENLSIPRLQELGVKTEFLGRVSLVFSTVPVTLQDLLMSLEQNKLLEDYLTLFAKQHNRETVMAALTTAITERYSENLIGYRLLTSLIHQYFISGGKIPPATTADNQEAAEYRQFEELYLE